MEMLIYKCMDRFIFYYYYIGTFIFFASLPWLADLIREPDPEVSFPKGTGSWFRRMDDPLKIKVPPKLSKARMLLVKLTS